MILVDGRLKHKIVGGKLGKAASIRLKLAHKSCFVLSCDTNRFYKHEIPPDKRLDSQKPERAHGPRISLTFRAVHTFLLVPAKQLFGGGAVCKTRQQLEARLAAGDGAHTAAAELDAQMQRMLEAFSRENKTSDEMPEYVVGFGGRAGDC